MKYNNKAKPKIWQNPDLSHPSCRNLVMWLLTNENGGLTAYDVSGNNNNGALNSVTWEGDSAEFNGSTSHIDCGNPTNLNFGTGDFTVGMTVKPYDTAEREIINKALTTGTFGGYEIRASSATKFQFWPYNTGGNSVSSTTTVIANKERRIICTRLAGTIYIAIDGTIEASASNSVDVTSTQPFRIGFDNPGWTGATWSGTIDDTRVWNRGMTKKDIEEDYENRFAAFTRKRRVYGLPSAPPVGIKRVHSLPMMGAGL